MKNVENASRPPFWTRKTEKVAVILKISPLSLWKLHYLMRFCDAAQARDID